MSSEKMSNQQRQAQYINHKKFQISEPNRVFTIYPTVGGGGAKIKISRFFYSTYMGDIATT